MHEHAGSAIVRARKPGRTERMRPDELAVRAATKQDASFMAALRAHPDTTDFLAVSDQTEADLQAELGSGAATPAASTPSTKDNRSSR